MGERGRRGRGGVGEKRSGRREGGSESVNKRVSASANESG